MKQMTFILKTPLTTAKLHAVMAAEKALTAALEGLGYSLENDNVSVKQGPFGRYAVYVDNEYFGVWDMHRKTFVD